MVTNYESISDETKMHVSLASDFGAEIDVGIDFAVHGTADGAELYYVLRCILEDQSDWSCFDLYEKRRVSLSSPDDFIDLDDSIDAETAEIVAETVRAAIIVNAEGHYKYVDFGEERISENSLNILSISVSDDDEYRVIADINRESGCANHTIVVRTTKCSEMDCEYEVIKNRIEHTI